ncbi:MAG TPA: hypothetical protein DCK95_05655 [Anaerolineaceae bacterium]|nr:hypothetical protein [Anaerolineaceae bacterium]
MNKISVVTPTLRRPNEVLALITNLSKQILLPYELILVDGAPLKEDDTEQAIKSLGVLPFILRHIRHNGGTAIQRNVGIDHANGDFIAFIDDDIRLEPDFFKIIIDVFNQDLTLSVGGIAGYISNQYLNPETSRRWIWNRRLHLYTTFEPGRYDFQSGYPVNRYLQPPHDGIREIDFMGAGCALWRKEVFTNGLRFAPFFTGLGVLEDAHLALRAGQSWKLLECGSAKCVHLHAPGGREKSRKIARKTAVNYRFVFVDIVPQRSIIQEYRFWRNQVFDLIRFFLYALINGGRESWGSVLGKLEGIIAATKIKPSESN